MEKIEKFMAKTKNPDAKKTEKNEIMPEQIPQEIRSVLDTLQKAGFEAYAVGGCVRDILLGRKPKDWDITTNAKPLEIRKIFPKSFYENKFFTVTVQTESKDPTLKEIEITTYRSETKYSDKRHPDEVIPAETLEEDLARRDFTVNALALRSHEVGKPGSQIEVIDLFGGKEDLKNKLIRAVGNPADRFEEDALRLVRAIRFATTLDFKLESNTLKAVIEKSGLLKSISGERIRDEFLKIIESENAANGIDVLRETSLLRYIIPELLEGYGMKQNKHHVYEIYDHNLRSLDAAARRKFSIDVRLAALLHDIAKPRTKVGVGADCTFYDHQIVGEKMAKTILPRLKFPVKQIEKIATLIRCHMFTHEPGITTESSIRRLVRKAGRENMDELFHLRVADRIGSGVPKAQPFRLRHMQYLVEKVSQDPIAVTMLKANGEDVMKILGIKPGPKVGQILDILLDLTLENPKLNKKSVFQKEIKRLGELSDSDLASWAKTARIKRDEIETKRDEATKEKYWVT